MAGRRRGTPAPRLHHLALRVADCERALAFYSGLLGLPEVRLFTHVGMTENQRLYERRGYVETHRLQEEAFARVFYRKEVS